MEQIKTRIEAVKNCDDSKDRIIEDLCVQVQSLGEALNREKDEVQRERALSNLFQQETNKKHSALDNKLREIAKLTFVSVLIDGDCMNFNDNLLREGQGGGHQAARLLKKYVEEYLRKLESPANISIRIRVYANVKGLAKAYRDAGILNDVSELGHFIQGFNMEDVSCDFVDAGSGKECSDEKLKAVFHQDILDVHCHHILFGGSADNGYARLLGPHRDSKRVSLLEATPFAHELAELTSSFTTISFPNVFRASKLPSGRKVSSGTATTLTRTSPTQNYASVARTPRAVVSSSDTATTTATAHAPAAAEDGNQTKPIIPRNAQGQRIDPPLRFSPHDVAMLKPRKLCNQYHILGNCTFNPCNHTHGDRLTGQRLVALKHIARMSPCPFKLYCEDSVCIRGHRCPRHDCDTTFCWFPQEMHGVDARVVVS